MVARFTRKSLTRYEFGTSTRLAPCIGKASPSNRSRGLHSGQIGFPGCGSRRTVLKNVISSAVFSERGGRLSPLCQLPTRRLSRPTRPPSPGLVTLWLDSLLLSCGLERWHPCQYRAGGSLREGGSLRSPGVPRDTCQRAASQGVCTAPRWEAPRHGSWRPPAPGSLSPGAPADGIPASPGVPWRGSLLLSGTGLRTSANHEPVPPGHAFRRASGRSLGGALRLRPGSARPRPLQLCSFVEPPSRPRRWRLLPDLTSLSLESVFIPVDNCYCSRSLWIFSFPGYLRGFHLFTNTHFFSYINENAFFPLATIKIFIFIIAFL